ncbi:hypothetical protein F4804DRAFT_304485 [Jackrogersella minutella]|nr:hypothetical protein F4804DRAFT_304485 [Jackrogersella minutella]
MPMFTDSATFPTFNELPSASSLAASSATPAAWFLLAQIKEDMTITKPTVIVRDRSGAEYAVTFDDGDHRGLGGINTKARFRKGHTLVVPRAARTDREGKKAVVRVPEGEGAAVRVLPGSLEQVSELGEVLAGIEETEPERMKRRRCGACGRGEGKSEGEGEGKRPLMQCMGCGAAAYCSKECQARGWNEMGHKTNCKVIKAIKEIWPQ